MTEQRARQLGGEAGVAAARAHGVDGSEWVIQRIFRSIIYGDCMIVTYVYVPVAFWNPNYFVHRLRSLKPRHCVFYSVTSALQSSATVTAFGFEVCVRQIPRIINH